MPSVEHGLSAPGTAKGKLQRACLDILNRHATAGEVPTSARFVYYELKQAGYPLAHHRARRDDQDVIDAITHLREAGIVPWDWLADETRDVTVPFVAGSVTDWLLHALDQARIDPWGKDGPPMVITESRGVRAVLRGTAFTYAARITSTNGQANGYLHTEVVPLLVPGDPVAYFGDWNPAGSMIEDNTRRILEDEIGGPLEWERLAVTPDQAERENLPPKPGTDRRFSDGRPHVSYECEALGQRRLVELLTGWLDGLLPEPLDRVREREQDQRAEVRRLLDGDQ